MRNYFKNLQLTPTTSNSILLDALDPSSHSLHNIHSKQRPDALSVLLDLNRKNVYSDTVELYETMRIAQTCLSESGGIDTHKWEERLANFGANVEGEPDLRK